MVIVEKNSPINLNVVALRNGKELLNTTDNKHIQKWATNGLKSAGYLEKTEEGHIFGYDKYLFVVDNNTAKRFTIKDIRLQHKKLESENNESKNKNVSRISKSNLVVQDNPKSNKPLRFTKHSIEEILNDHPDLKTEENALVWGLEQYSQSKLMDDSTVGTDNKPRSMYCIGASTFVVEECETEDVVVTFFEVKSQPLSVKALIKDLLGIELKKLQRKERSLEKKNALKIAELELEKAELQLKQLKTRSKTIKDSCLSRIASIDLEVSTLQKEVFEVKREKTQMVKGIAFYA